MLINNYFSSIAGDCIRISYCDYHWRNWICNGIWRCDRSNISSIICDQVNIKEIKVEGLRENRRLFSFSMRIINNLFNGNKIHFIKEDLNYVRIFGGNDKFYDKCKLWSC